MWIILETVRKDGRTKYRVKCACGYEGFRRKDHVDSGRSVECKNCSAKRTFINVTHSNSCFVEKGQHKGTGLITKTYYNHIKYGAQRRNYTFNVSIDFLWELFESQNGRCALSGVPLEFSSERISCNPDYSKITASLDRIDSSLGYEQDNVQWVHKEINMMKQSYSQKDFIKWCSLVHANHEPSST